MVAKEIFLNQTTANRGADTKMVELSENFTLECDELDKDHERLVEMVNEITAKLEEGITENCEDTVRAFINFTKGHFNREEQFLIKLGYPDVSKHRKHHHELYEKMDHIMEFARSASANELARKSLKKELVFFLMDDVITTDLNFKSFIGGEKT